MWKRSASMARRRRSNAFMMPGCSPARCRTDRSATSFAPAFGDNVVNLEDPYRFPPVLSDYDLYLLGEGTHRRIYDKLGAHPMTLDGIDGVAFVVLAPNAKAVSVVGDFNFWNPLRHPMRVRGVGYWELFVPHARTGDRYKFDITGSDGRHLPLKSDPVAFAAELRPSTASIVIDETKIPAPAPGPLRHQCARNADLDLRGASGLVAAQERQ